MHHDNRGHSLQATPDLLGPRFCLALTMLLFLPPTSWNHLCARAFLMVEFLHAPPASVIEIALTGDFPAVMVESLV
jgi:hypothetical protein